MRTPLVFIALIGWVPAMIVLFALVPARKAATIALIGAWLLLPPSVLVSPACPIIPS